MTNLEIVKGMTIQLDDEDAIRVAKINVINEIREIPALEGFGK